MQPQYSYLVCATPRSGSTLLCEALTNSGLAGRPKEYFEALYHSGLPRKPVEYFTDLNDPEVQADIATLLGQYSQYDTAPSPLAHHGSYTEYLASVIVDGTTANCVFGAKLMWGHLDGFMSYLHTVPQYKTLALPELLTTIFFRPRFITVTRRDKVRQAVSLWRAVQTQAWHRDDGARSTGDRGTNHALTFHFAAIEHLRRQIIAHETAWQQFFTLYGIQPFAVVYEDLAVAYEETALEILGHLAVPIAEKPLFAPRRMKQQADSLSEQWVQQYYACIQGQEERAGD